MNRLPDAFLLAVATAREIRYMAKAELFGRRPAAAILRVIGAFPIFPRGPVLPTNFIEGSGTHSLAARRRSFLVLSPSRRTD
jgi:hypothetical protein